MELYKTTNTIINLFENDQLVHTITTEDSTNIDHNKTNIYPLVNIELLDSIYHPIVQTFNFEIIVIQQLDIKKDLNKNKYDSNNTVDNHNECNVILTNFLKKLERTNGITIKNTPVFNYLYNSGLNGTDGIQTLISVEVLNTNKFC